jgi:hypothetical protein
MNNLTPEPQMPRVPEASAPPKPPEAKPVEKPLGPPEQAIIQKIKQDGNPDDALRDIAGEKTTTESTVSQSPFQFQEAQPGARSNRPIVGDEIISPTAIGVNERNPDGSWNLKPAQDRGYLNAIGNAWNRQDLPYEARQANTQAIVEAAIKAGVPRDQIGEHLQALGIKAIKVEDVAQPQTTGITSNAEQVTPRVDTAKLMKSVELYADSALHGNIPPAALQNYITYAIENGVSPDAIEATLAAKGIGRAKPTEAKPQFDVQKPIDGKTYNALSKRFNDIRSRLLRDGDRETFSRLDGAPIGRILNGPFPKGDTVEARLAYDKISNLLDGIEGVGQSHTVETPDTVSGPAERVMDEKTATQILGSDRPATNAEKIAAATQYPKIADRWGWSKADIDELRQSIPTIDTPEADERANPTTEKTTAGEQLHQEVFGKLYGDLLTTFTQTPSATKEDLMLQVGAYAKEHGLAGPDLGRAVGMVNRFCRTRDIVRNVREQYLDDRALFEHTFGFYPEGDVQATIETIDIVFYIPNVDDRTRARAFGRNAPLLADRTATGSVNFKTQDPSLNGLVITLEHNDTPDVLDHERQHIASHQLLNIDELSDPTNETLDTISARINTGENPESTISSYLESLKSIRLRRSSEEALACFAGGTTPEQIKSALTNPLSSYGRAFRGVQPNLEDMIVGRVGEQYRQFIRENGDMELGKAYDLEIGECIDAFQALRSKGYSQAQAVGRLAYIHPLEWKNYVANMTSSQSQT